MMEDAVDSSSCGCLKQKPEWHARRSWLRQSFVPSWCKK
eukprot:symbB.v1.2.033686.t1/scaffold4221.1/size42938/1